MLLNVVVMALAAIIVVSVRRQGAQDEHWPLFTVNSANKLVSTNV